MKTLNETLEARKKELLEWLEEENPNCVQEQRHLDGGTSERAYWHYGYASALKDVLELLGDTSTSRH